jgi:UPF0755 protein
VLVIGNVLKAAVAIAMVIGVVVAGIFIYRYSSGLFGSSNIESGRQVPFVINPGDSVSTIADKLKEAGVLEQGSLIDSAAVFKTRLKLRGDEGKIKAGRFVLTTGMDVDALIDTLVNSSGEAGIKFQVIEGWRLEEIAAKLSADGVVSQTRFLELTTKPENVSLFASEFLTQSGKPGDSGLEGYLFPDTYNIEWNEGDNSEAVINVMLKTMEEKFSLQMRQDAAAKGRSTHDVLTIASIVQREGVVKAEFPQIAAVYWNRIANDMRLDADPTVQYAAGKEPNWWRVIDFTPRDLDHPYNTYIIYGMPPGPICSPSEDAIRAAVYPAEESPYLYFVAKKGGSGEHVFATTLEEHNRNVIENQP